MKKVLLSLLVIFSVFTASFAAEWGGLFTNESTADISDVSQFSNIEAYDFVQSDGLYLWVTKPFNSTSDWYAAGEIYYKYYWDISTKAFYNIVDSDLLKVSGHLVLNKGVMNLAFGRFSVSDNTGIIFNQLCDGASLKYSVPAMELSVYAGYTGLLNSLTVTMLDETGYATGSNASDNWYSLSKSYIPLAVSFEFPDFMNNQTLGIQGMAFFDPATAYNRYYADLMLKGPLFGSLYYSLATTFGFPNFKAVSNYTTLKVLIYNGNHFALQTGVDYASGNHAIFNAFKGFTSQTAYYSIYEPDYSGLLLPGVKVIIAGNTTEFELGATAVCGVPDASFTFKGVEGDINTTVNLFSDLQLKLLVKAYYDLAGNGSESDYSVALNLAFAF